MCGKVKWSLAIREQSLCHDRSSGRWHWNTATGSCTSHWHGRPSSQDKNTAHTVAIIISFFVTLLCCSSSPVPVSNGRECSLAVDSSLFAVSQSTSSPAANDCRCCCCCCRCLTAEHQRVSSSSPGGVFLLHSSLSQSNATN